MYSSWIVENTKSSKVNREKRNYEYYEFLNLLFFCDNLLKNITKIFRKKKIILFQFQSHWSFQ